MVERSFLKLRKFGFITIRVNAKNDKTPPPKIVALYNLGDMTGILELKNLENTAELRQTKCKQEQSLTFERARVPF